jgi:Uma2 family endonuclease
MSSSHNSSDGFISGVNKRAGLAELVNGRVVSCDDEVLGRNMSRGHVFFAFQEGLARAALDLNLYTYGALVRISDKTVRMPDSIVQSQGGSRARLVDAPFIVTDVKFEHLSKGEMQQRMADYFSLASVQHYVVVDLDRGLVLHHERSVEDKILTRIVRDGFIDFGDFDVSVEAILGLEKTNAQVIESADVVGANL